MSYGWPVKPFDVQHPVRGFFCDPRIGAKGSKAFHFGIDVSAPDGTPSTRSRAARFTPEAPKTSVSSRAAAARTRTGTSFRASVTDSR